MPGVGIGLGISFIASRRGESGGEVPLPPPDLEHEGFDLEMYEEFLVDAPEGEFYAEYPNMGYYPSPWPDTSGNGTYTPEFVSAQNGRARIRLHTQEGTTYVSALNPLLPHASGSQDVAWADGQLYGRYEVRFRALNPAPGFKIAWLLWPDSDDWTEGEIDFPEVTFDPGGTIWAFNHEVTGTPSNNSTAHNTQVSPYEWHTCAIEWEPDAVRFYLDDTLVATDTEHVPSTAMHWVLQCETSLDGIPPDPETECIIEIDYVAQWSFPVPTPPGEPVRLYLRSTTSQVGTDGTNVWDLAPTQGGSFDWLYPDGASDDTWVETHRFQSALSALPSDDEFLVSTYITDLSEATEARIRLHRLNASGVVQESSPYSTVIEESGVITRTITFDADWQEGDMLAVSYEHRRTSGEGSTTIGMRVQDPDGFVEYIG